mmetsp:Transcript_18750/g.50898  ORF Transcript_18750/g.50898 Transcript_18750/m.50898 type:complete len:665 (+) Transcript_18750:251-2245(+)
MADRREEGLPLYLAHVPLAGIALVSPWLVRVPALVAAGAHRHPHSHVRGVHREIGRALRQPALWLLSHELPAHRGEVRRRLDQARGAGPALHDVRGRELRPGARRRAARALRGAVRQGQRDPGGEDHPRRLHPRRRALLQDPRHEDRGPRLLRRRRAQLRQRGPARAHRVLLVQLPLRAGAPLAHERGEAPGVAEHGGSRWRVGRLRRAARRRPLLLRGGEHHVPLAHDGLGLLRCQRSSPHPGLVESNRHRQAHALPDGLQHPPGLCRVHRLHHPGHLWWPDRRCLRPLQHHGMRRPSQGHLVAEQGAGGLRGSADLLLHGRHQLSQQVHVRPLVRHHPLALPRLLRRESLEAKHDGPLRWHGAAHRLGPLRLAPARRPPALCADDLHLRRRGPGGALRAVPLHGRVLGPRRGPRGALRQRDDPRLHDRGEPGRLRHGRGGLGAWRRVPRDHLARRHHVRAHRRAADGGPLHVRLPHREVCRGLLHGRHLRLRHQAPRLPLPARARRVRLPQVCGGRDGRGPGGVGLRRADHRRAPPDAEGDRLQRLPPRQVREAAEPDAHRVHSQEPAPSAPGGQGEDQPARQRGHSGELPAAGRQPRRGPLRLRRLDGLPRGEGDAVEGGARDVPKAGHQAHHGRGGWSAGGHDHQEVVHRPRGRDRARRG